MASRTGRFSCAVTALLAFAIGAALPSSSFATPALAEQTLFALAPGGVAEYDVATGKAVGFIKRGQLSTVASGPFAHVWVGSFSANPASLIVDEYLPQRSRPIRSIATLQEEGHIAVSAQGDLAVAGFGGGACCANRLLLYRYGSTSPTRTIVPGAKGFLYVAWDQRGNCWIDGSSGDVRQPYFFGYVAPNATKIVVVPFAGSPPPGPLTVDASGNIVVATSGGLEAFDATGKLLSQTPLQAMPRAITGIALSADNSTLFVSSTDTLLTTYAYPAGGPPTHAFGWYSQGLAIGGT
jgi:hypothetical protein